MRSIVPTVPLAPEGAVPTEAVFVVYGIQVAVQVAVQFETPSAYCAYV